MTIPARSSLRPVTDGMVTLAGLLDRYGELRGELAAVAGDVTDLFARLTDPVAVDQEIAEIEHEAARRIAAAEQARIDAEQESEAMAVHLERAAEVEGLALAAAAEARANAKSAIQQLQRVETEAAGRVSDAEQERDHAHAEAETMLAELTSARLAQARAEGERDLALGEHRALIEGNKQLRQLLDAERAAHREQIEHRDVEYARAITAAHAMSSHAAREHRQQLSAVMRRYSADTHAAPSRANDEKVPAVQAESSST
ncbi:hypothetical protein ACIHDR_11570 [Nocardia sp. NPDC052278]|uniref:hypothetical protein n=1 Tax=unclassified Nocardia TaxID=2637762 RepID=UPI0036BD3CF4